MAKNVIHAIEDCIIPLLLQELFLTLIRAYPKGDPVEDYIAEWLNTTNGYLKSESAKILPKFKVMFNNTLWRIKKKIINYMESNGFTTTKGFLALVIIAEQVQQDEPIDNVLAGLAERANDMLEGNEDLENLILSARKQAAKILLIIQNMGYFK